MKKFLKEFKDFAMKGNFMDLAIGMIIGAAFTAIVNSVVNDLISPIIGLFAKDNFAALSINIGKVTIKYGSFLMAIVNFVITAFVLFLIVKALNKAREARKNGSKDVPAETKICPFCKSEISIDATRCPHCTSEL